MAPTVCKRIRVHAVGAEGRHMDSNTARIEVTYDGGWWVIRTRSTVTNEAVIVGRERLAHDALTAARHAGNALRLDVHHHLEDHT